MKQVFIKKGNAVVEEVPAPCVEDGMVLVRNYYSCISAGTEMSSISNTAKPLWKRALDNPDEAKKALQIITDQGLKKTTQMIKGRLDSGNVVGYSSAGIVIEVGKNIKGILPGDRVACAGAGYASHAEIITVPFNLVVKIGKEQNLAHASTVALGSIAMQGVRRANPTIGEIFTIVGLGILGQLTVQFLQNNGCIVIGVDVDEKRGKIALNQGMDFFMVSGLNM